MTATGIENEMILASAGSGKTYQLTNRYIRLMALGAEPERIVALTFTRKAAGEFFDEILGKLARAARDPDAAGDLAKAIEAPDLRPADFLQMLTRLVERMHLLELGTLDSFFYRIVRSFPFELGLAGAPEVLDENAMRTEKRRVFRHVFRNPHGGEDVRREFIEAFKQATWGTEEKRLSARLDDFIDRHHEVYLAAPERGYWGNPRRIWPEGTAWLGEEIDAAAEVENLDCSFAGRDFTAAQRETWNLFSAAVREWEPGAPWSDAMKRPIANALKVWRDLEAGEAEWTLARKKLKLSPGECGNFVRLVRRLFGAELEKKLQVTRGLYEILRGYETLYADLVRAGGRLTFGDILVLLSGDGSGGRPRFTQHSAEGRLAVDYRLDGRYDHWLLDEFQDTSYVQWRALSDLVDEVVQDPEGRRSFFYVGDVKQAIFAWREGDARLFREIYDHYNAASGAGIVERRMSESWRSGPAVIETVNRVFGAGEVLRELFPASAVDRWREGWDPHAARHSERSGYACFCRAEGEEARYAAVLELLRRVDPLRRGLSCAILVQRNRKAAEILQYLRERSDIPVAGEMDIRPGGDNPLGTVLISLFKYAAHPGDRYAREHILMTPLGELAGSGDGLPGTGREVLASIHRDGFAAVAEEWIERLEGAGAIDAFNRERGEILISAARAFDRLGNRSVDDFIEFLGAYSVRESGTEHTVRVMTIHKAKGLGFDMTVLPDLERSRLDSRSKGSLAVQRTEHREVEWVLDPPVREIMENDEVLARYDAEAAADACYERFSQLYVAMTRARHALYLIGEPMKAGSKSPNFIKWLHETLSDRDPGSAHWGEAEVACLYEIGDPDWYTAFEAVPEEPLPASEPAVSREFEPRVRYRRGTPSRAETRTVSAENLFSPDSRRSLDFGTRVHEVFARIGWYGSESRGEVEAWKEENADNPLTVSACDEVLACLDDEGIRNGLARPAPDAELWRERTFEVILDDEWLTGTFDRVVLVPDAGGTPARAEIVDFKTDRVEAAVLSGNGPPSGHARQLATYRRVLAYMTGLPEERIACRLLFTHPRAWVDVT